MCSDCVALRRWGQIACLVDVGSRPRSRLRFKGVRQKNNTRHDTCREVELPCVLRSKRHRVPLVKASFGGLAGVGLELTVNQGRHQLNSVRLGLLPCGAGRFVRR